jgi:hypothetical protein
MQFVPHRKQLSIHNNRTVRIIGNTNTLCGPNAKFQYIKAGGTFRTTRLERANIGCHEILINEYEHIENGWCDYFSCRRRSLSDRVWRRSWTTGGNGVRRWRLRPISRYYPSIHFKKNNMNNYSKFISVATVSVKTKHFFKLLLSAQWRSCYTKAVGWLFRWATRPSATINTWPHLWNITEAHIPVVNSQGNLAVYALYSCTTSCNTHV